MKVPTMEQMRIGRLVKKLGGPAAVEKAIGAPRNSVKMWRIDGRIPYRWRHAVKELGNHSGIQWLLVELELLELR